MFVLFFYELSDLLDKLSDIVDSDQLVACSDFNCPGVDLLSIDDDLTSVFDTRGFR